MSAKSTRFWIRTILPMTALFFTGAVLAGGGGGGGGGGRGGGGGGGGGGGRGGRRGGGAGPGAVTTPPAKPVSATTHAAPLPAGMEDYKTVDNCITTTMKIPNASESEPGYLGLTLDSKDGKLIVSGIAPASPAEKAGFQIDDAIITAEGHVPGDEQDFRDIVQSLAPGTLANFSVARKNRPAAITLSALIAPVSRPLSLTAPNDRPTLGVSVNEESGTRVTTVDPNSPAASAGLRVDDMILKVDDIPLDNAIRLADILSTKKIGDTIALLVQRGAQTATLRAQLAAQPNAGGGGRGRGAGGAGGGGGANAAGPTYFDRPGQMWKKDTLKLALIGLEYPDQKHTAAITDKNWEDAFFSHGTYKQTATGQQAFGSEYDYYYEMSYAQLKLDGNMLPWVAMSKNRMDYSQGTGTGPQNRTLLAEAVANLQARDGNNFLDNYDAIIFIYAGNRVNTTRGGIYWPHKSTVNVGQRRVNYVLIPEGQGAAGLGGGGGGGGRAGGARAGAPAGPEIVNRMTDISVVCHETGHILGLPDLYARPEDPGSVGLGNWEVMSQQAGNGRPQQMSAWCKDELGWIKPAVIDPTVKQKLVLGPIENYSHECYKIPIRPDGSEYFLLENRAKIGFDASLPAEGLLIWRVTDNRPLLEESHGIDGPQGPQAYTASVPFPSPSNDSFTPFTTPSSRSKLGGGTPLYLTNIKRMPDGRISFWIGYQFD